MDHLLSKEKECKKKRFLEGEVSCLVLRDLGISQDRSLKTEQHEEDITEKV